MNVTIIVEQINIDLLIEQRDYLYSLLERETDEQTPQLMGLINLIEYMINRAAN